MTALPTSARTVVIGGGIVGCSTAYHLAKLGWTDTVLVEKHQLTSGSTFHAAGLVGQLRTSANITQLLGNSVELYKTLEAETGQATGWKMNGGLRLAIARVDLIDNGREHGHEHQKHDAARHELQAHHLATHILHHGVERLVFLIVGFDVGHGSALPAMSIVER